MNAPQPSPAPSAEPPEHHRALLAQVRGAYRSLDPVPSGLVPRIQAVLAMAGSDVDAELMQLVEQSSELAGVRGTTAYTLRFQHEQTELMLRISAEGDESRVDGWVVPAEPMSATALAGGAELSGPEVVSAAGRFELAGLRRGLVRLRLEPHDATRPAFLTPTFEI